MDAGLVITKKQSNSNNKIIRLVLQSPKNSQIVFKNFQTEILEATIRMFG